MGSRVDLNTLLIGLLGTRNVYFQPPPTIKMVYPCIVYSISNGSTRFADNVPYSYSKRYQLTVIDTDPDTLIPDKLATSLPQCTFDRHFSADNLNHYVFVIWF